MNIGLLLPRSTYYSSISFDLFNGIKARISQEKHPEIKIFTENIGFGAEKQMVYRAAEQLIMQHDVELVFAYVGHSVAQLLRPLFLATNRMLIVLDAGAHLPHEWPSSENIVYHSLNNAIGAYHLGDMARRDGYENGGVATGYYDGGYLHTYALAKGMERSNVTLEFNIATGYTREDFSMAQLKEHASGDHRRAIMALFSGDFAQWFYHDLEVHTSENRPNVYVSPFALEESMLKKTKHPGGTLKGVATWGRSIDTPENHRFVRALEESGKSANLFSLLGWEAGCILERLKQLRVQGNGRATLEKLLMESIETPRGTVAFDPVLKTSYAPMYEASVISTEEGTCALHIHEEVNTKALLEELVTLNLENTVSGWQNSYACN